MDGLTKMECANGLTCSNSLLLCYPITVVELPLKKWIWLVLWKKDAFEFRCPASWSVLCHHELWMLIAEEAWGASCGGSTACWGEEEERSAAETQVREWSRVTDGDFKLIKHHHHYITGYLHSALLRHLLFTVFNSVCVSLFVCVSAETEKNAAPFSSLHRIEIDF